MPLGNGVASTRSRRRDSGNWSNRACPRPRTSGWTRRRYSSIRSAAASAPAQPAATPDDHVRAGLGLDGGDLGREVAPRDPGLGPGGLCVAERLREHHLGDVIHRCGVRVVGLRPVRRHLLVRDAPHEVGTGLAYPVQLPLLQLSVRYRDPGVFTVATDEPVQRHRHVQDDSSHDNLSLLVLLPLLLRWSGSRYRPGTTAKLIAAKRGKLSAQAARSADQDRRRSARARPRRRQHLLPRVMGLAAVIDSATSAVHAGGSGVVRPTMSSSPLAERWQPTISSCGPLPHRLS